MLDDDEVAGLGPLVREQTPVPLDVVGRDLDQAGVMLPGPAGGLGVQLPGDVRDDGQTALGGAAGASDRRLPPVTTVIAILAPIFGFIGVLVGVRLSARHETTRWLRDERKAAYIEYLDLLTALVREFSGQVRDDKFTGRLRGEQGRRSGSEIAGALAKERDEAFSSQVQNIQHQNLRLELLMGSDVGHHYANARDAVDVMVDAWKDAYPTEETWEEAADRMHRAIAILKVVMRRDLGVKPPSRWRERRSKVIVIEDWM